MYHCSSLAKTPVIPIISRVSMRPKFSNPSSTPNGPHHHHHESPKIANGFNFFSLGTLKSLPIHKNPFFGSENASKGATFLFEYRSRPSRSLFAKGQPYSKTREGCIVAMQPRFFSSGHSLSGRAVESRAVVKPRNFHHGFHLKFLMKLQGGGFRVFSWSSHQKSVEYDGGGDGTASLPWIKKGGKSVENRSAAKTNRSSWEESAESYFSRNGHSAEVDFPENGGNMLRDNARRGVRRVQNMKNSKHSYGKGDKEENKDLEYQRWNMNLQNAEKKSAVRNNHSSWEESAERHMSRNDGFAMSGGEMLKEGMGRRVRREENLKNNSSGYVKGDREEVDGDDDDPEPIDDERWHKIKNTYKGFVDRESRFEKPEVHRWNKQENWGKKTWKEATESSVPKMAGQGVYGIGPVLAALSIGRREFYALYVQEGLDLSGNNRKKKDKKGVEKVLKIAEKIGLKVIEASKHDLNMVVDNRPHQGLVLDASPLEMVNIKELDPVSVEGQRAPLWVALDEVTDPQNLGAIIRSAYFFGAEGVVLCVKNSAPLSGVVSKASAGSLELIELRSCKNMMQFLSSSIENHWRVLGGSVSSRALPLSEVKAGQPTILVLGSEGIGLRPLVEKSCSQLIRIPGNLPANGNLGETEVEAEESEQNCFGQELKTFLAVESLNVSVAAGVLLYHLVGNRSPSVSENPTVALD